MARAINAPASTILAIGVTVIIVFASMYNQAMTFGGTTEAADVHPTSSVPKEESEGKPQLRHTYVSVRITRPELLTGFRIILGSDSQLPDVEHVRAEPFRVEVRRANQWHDAFLEALELELTRRVAQNDLGFAQVIWDALCSNTKAASSFETILRRLPDTAEGIDTVLRRISANVSDYANAIRGPHGNYANARNPFGSRLVKEIPTLVDNLERNVQRIRFFDESEDGFGLVNGSPASLSAAGLIIWERMRFRLVRGNSVLGRELVRHFGFHRLVARPRHFGFH